MVGAGLARRPDERRRDSGMRTEVDGNADDGVVKAFRQTGLQEKKGRFGRVMRFHYYGELFRPELSNLAIGSLGLSMRFLKNSSVDLVLHSYRERHASRRLADSRLERNPTGNSRDLGRELDLVLAFRESEQLEFITALGAFRAGSVEKWLTTSSWG